MEKEYSIRKATMAEVSFIADVIIEGEKGMTNNLGLATLFELNEEKVKELVLSMLKEEIDGCEFSISSFFITFYQDKPVAAVGGWLEGYYENMPSSILKSSLILATFPKENIMKAKNKTEIIKDIQIEREFGAYHLEYSFVDNEHRGKRLVQELVKVHLDYAKKIDQNVKKAQIQVFENNKIIIKVYEKSGFIFVKRFVSSNKETLNYLPYNVKLLMEKNL